MNSLLKGLYKSIRPTTLDYKDLNQDIEFTAEGFVVYDSYKKAHGILNNNIFILDIDYKEGKKKGLKSLTKLEKILNLGEENKLNQITYSLRTPSGGYHIYFSLPKGVDKATFSNTLLDTEGNLLDDIEIKIKDGVVAGSHYKDASGRRYVVCNNKTSAIECPKKLLEMIQNKNYWIDNNTDEIEEDTVDSLIKSTIVTYYEELYVPSNDRNSWSMECINYFVGLKIKDKESFNQYEAIYKFAEICSKPDSLGESHDYDSNLAEIEKLYETANKYYKDKEKLARTKKYLYFILKKFTNREIVIPEELKYYNNNVEKISVSNYFSTIFFIYMKMLAESKAKEQKENAKTDNKKALKKHYIISLQGLYAEMLVYLMSDSIYKTCFTLQEDSVGRGNIIKNFFVFTKDKKWEVFFSLSNNITNIFFKPEVLIKAYHFGTSLFNEKDFIEFFINKINVTEKSKHAAFLQAFGSRLPSMVGFNRELVKAPTSDVYIFKNACFYDSAEVQLGKKSSVSKKLECMLTWDEFKEKSYLPTAYLDFNFDTQVLHKNTLQEITNQVFEDFKLIFIKLPRGEQELTKEIIERTPFDKYKSFMSFIGLSLLNYRNSAEPNPLMVVSGKGKGINGGNGKTSLIVDIIFKLFTENTDGKIVNDLMKSSQKYSENSDKYTMGTMVNTRLLIIDDPKERGINAEKKKIDISDLIKEGGYVEDRKMGKEGKSVKVNFFKIVLGNDFDLVNIAPNLGNKRRLKVMLFENGIKPLAYRTFDLYNWLAGFEEDLIIEEDSAKEDSLDSIASYGDIYILKLYKAFFSKPENKNIVRLWKDDLAKEGLLRRIDSEEDLREYGLNESSWNGNPFALYIRCLRFKYTGLGFQAGSDIKVEVDSYKTKLFLSLVEFGKQALRGGLYDKGFTKEEETRFLQEESPSIIPGLLKTTFEYTGKSVVTFPEHRMQYIFKHFLKIMNNKNDERWLAIDDAIRDHISVGKNGFDRLISGINLVNFYYSLSNFYKGDPYKMLSKYKELRQVLDVYNPESYYVGNFLPDNYPKGKALEDKISKDADYKKQVFEEAYNKFIKDPLFTKMLNCLGYFEDINMDEYKAIKKEAKNYSGYKNIYPFFYDNSYNNRKFKACLEDYPYNIPTPFLIYKCFKTKHKTWMEAFLKEVNLERSDA